MGLRKTQVGYSQCTSTALKTCIISQNLCADCNHCEFFGDPLNSYRKTRKGIKGIMKKRVFAGILTLLITAAIFPATAARGAGEKWSPRDTSLETNQFSGTFNRWSQPATSFLARNADGSVTSVEANSQGNAVNVKTSDAFGRTLLNKQIPFELPIFGAFLSGNKYNYIAFGQQNTEQSYSKEVIRITKYDKSFTKIGSVSVTGGSAQTRIPFDAGCPRMAENGDALILHTTRERYTSNDGLNHQSNLTLIIDTGKMAVTYISAEYPQNHTSHSFDQYVIFDGDVPVYLDLGDAYPRAVVLQKGELTNGSAAGHTLISATMMNIPGQIGANQTGVTLGGLAVSDKNYLAVIATVDHSKVVQYTNFGMTGLSIDQRDIVVCSVRKSFSNGDMAKQITIGKYTGTNTIASTPRVLSNGDNSFTVIWAEFETANRSGVPVEIVTQVIDSEGQPVGGSKRYADDRAFYREFLGVRALPVDPSPLDTASDWAQNSIISAIEKGFVLFDLHVNYKDVITRAEFCQMSIRFIEYMTGKSIDTVMNEKGVNCSRSVFSDTNDPSIQAAYALGVTNGTVAPTQTEPGIFSPDGKITREQAATMLRNVCRVLDMNVDGAPPAGFSDSSAIAGWATDSVNFCHAKGIMEGTGNNKFSPRETFTKQQSIAAISRIHK